MFLAIVGGLALVVLAVWFGHRSLGSAGPTTSGGNALGGFDVFDPGRARAQDDLDSKEHEGEALPAPNDEDLPVRVDLGSGTVRIRKPSPAPDSEPDPDAPEDAVSAD